AVILHFYEGKRHDEVAAALGCPKGTAASRIRRGLERLRESLAGAGYAAAAARVEGAIAGLDGPAPQSSLLHDASGASASPRSLLHDAAPGDGPMLPPPPAAASLAAVGARRAA